MLVGEDPKFPLGRRGDRPLRVPMDKETGRRIASAIPGASWVKGSLTFSWDALAVVQRQFNTDVPLPEPVIPFPGLEEYRACFAEKLRKYQKEMLKFLVLRSYAINADPMRSGKTPTTLAAACIIGAKKVLIVCPSIAKLVWATELVKWMKQPSLILYGRSGDESREFCVRCNGTGRDSPGHHCPDCKSKNGQSYGYKIFHTREETLDALKRARFVIANYDILTPQMKHSAAGVRSEREDLPGWYGVLAAVGFDLCIIDEAHILRGRSKGNRVGESRRDKLKVVCQFIERVWELTGTPIFGRVADMWAMLDVLTHGLFGLGWDFDKRYANGHKGEYGWENDGMTNPDELKSRLDAFLLKRDRKEILPELPPKTRQIIRIDAGKADFKKPPKGTGSGGIHGALRVTANIKEDIVVEAVSNEAAEGGKCVVFTYLRDNAQAMYAAFEKAREKDPRLKLRNLRVWCVTGDVSTDARFKQAQAFREWEGAAIFIATIDSVPVAISLKGAQSVHFADLTFDPATLLQAEDRPYEMGTTGLAIIYYVVEKTIDEHVIELVLPKMEMLENILAESAATDFSHAFSSKQTPEQIAEEIWARMEANIV